MRFVRKRNLIVVSKRIKRPPKKQKAPQTNGWDALIRFMDLLYNLCKSGNIVGVLLFAVLTVVCIGFVRAPEDDVGQILKQFFLWQWGYFPPLTAALVFSIWVNFRQKKFYKRELERLAHDRHTLMHGGSATALRSLGTHRSSQINPLEADDDC